MMTKLTSEKQHEWQHSMMVRVVDNNDKSRRQASVLTCVPSLPSPSPLENNNRQTTEEQHKGSCNDYSIGETVHSPFHMIIESTSDQSIQAVSLLNKHDFALIKCSDGSYSYAILAYCSMKPNKGVINTSTEKCMTFIMCDVGSIKMVRQRHWGQFVRLVSGLPVRTTTKIRTTPKFPPSLDQHLEEHFVSFC